MNRKCAICGATHGLFELKFEADETDAGEEFSKYVCGSCWEVIGAIARRVAKSVLKDFEPDADIPGDFGTHQYHDIG